MYVGDEINVACNLSISSKSNNHISYCMYKDNLMAGIPLFRIIKASRQGLAEERIKASLDNRGGRQGLMDQDPSEYLHTDTHSTAHLNTT